MKKRHGKYTFDLKISFSNQIIQLNIKQGLVSIQTKKFTYKYAIMLNNSFQIDEKKKNLR